MLKPEIFQQLTEDMKSQLSRFKILGDAEIFLSYNTKGNHTIRGSEYLEVFNNGPDLHKKLGKYVKSKGSASMFFMLEDENSDAETIDYITGEISSINPKNNEIKITKIGKPFNTIETKNQ